MTATTATDRPDAGAIVRRRLARVRAACCAPRPPSARDSTSCFFGILVHGALSASGSASRDAEPMTDDVPPDSIWHARDTDRRRTCPPCSRWRSAPRDPVAAATFATFRDRGRAAPPSTTPTPAAGDHRGGHPLINVATTFVGWLAYVAQVASGSRRPGQSASSLARRAGDVGCSRWACSCPRGEQALDGERRRLLVDFPLPFLAGLWMLGWIMPTSCARSASSPRWALRRRRWTPAGSATGFTPPHSS